MTSAIEHRRDEEGQGRRERAGLRCSPSSPPRSPPGIRVVET
jgi:hypothetical protein